MFTRATTMVLTTLALAGCCGDAVCAEAARESSRTGTDTELRATAPLPDVNLTVDAERDIAPVAVSLHVGQQAVWTFASASPANALVRQTSAAGSDPVAAPYDPANPNELMTPLPKAMSGIFVISENQGGLVERSTPCVAPSTAKATRTVDGMPSYLCSSDPDPSAPDYQRTLDSTWTNPAVTGVFIRLKWSDIQTGPATYDDTLLLREVDQAVANGKLYSLGIKSGAENDATPAWLFEPVPDGAGLTPVTLDWNDDSASCATRPHDYGNPTDATYRELYLDMLSHVAAVLKADSARWRSLAYVKLSGANSRSAENRLPNDCKAGPGCICNNQAWAEAGYTPDGLLLFYEEQMERITTDFPDKSMSYSLIQAGFPRVNNGGCYLDEANLEVCPSGVVTPMPGPFAQTQAIIDGARQRYGDEVTIAHLGLGPKPDFSDPADYAPGTGCPLPLAPDGSLAHGRNGVGSGCPNKWATDVGAVGGPTHFQTNNASRVGNPAQLASALDNLWTNSNAAMLEIYEARAWEAGDAVLDPTLPLDEQRTLGQWNERLHERRRDDFPAFGDPAPTTLSFAFSPSDPAEQSFHYFVPESGPRRPAYYLLPTRGPSSILPPASSPLGYLSVFPDELGY